MATTSANKAAKEEGSTRSGTSRNPLLSLSYLTIVGLWGASQVVLIPYVVHLLLLVSAILYAASHSSLILREEADKSEGGGSEHSGVETLRKEDAYQFPIVGSASLFSLYLAFKYLDKDLVNLLIGAYFAVVGSFALTMTIAPAVEKVAPKFLSREARWEYKRAHSLPEWMLGPSPFELLIHVNGYEIVSFLISAVFCVYYFQTKAWYLNNVLGICFCLQGIERFSLGTYKIAAILLTGLFFYDIFWVFGTEVMVTVAKNLDGPIKILFPRSLERNEDGKIDLSLLGLGDIVLPGFFLAMLLRFDAHNAGVPVTYTDFHASFPKPYFHTTMVAYIFGLGCTMFVMIYFNAAQPALLYLVPACLGSSFLCAVVRGEVKELLEYSEEEEFDEEGEGETTKSDEAKKDK